MVKKLIALSGSAAILLATAAPVFAGPPWWWHHHGSRDVAVVYNDATAVSNTGGNSQDNKASVRLAMGGKAKAGSGSGSRRMTTGDATSDATAVAVTNTHVGCGPCAGGKHHRDFAKVDNYAYAESNTGANSQDNKASVRLAMSSKAKAGSGSGDRRMDTGNASSTANAWSVTNTHLSWMP